ncbi:MFS general substrate transporter [Stereum hirsutum FP-91666 SS1]|uniref:MFS general substrate transporter n=1 Tax=Stereum hirsutum (strain FP-91666) TaxID=721885 RepID=UPI000440EAC9|nr:MFS general substrate transporter [Stereum hirsutum FP-91666 SS1]EIM88380.1 MFS general substrate transporter [Stereum hirsutum FP-91666 SS1]
MKLDLHGMPLVPQPSDDPSDPLNFAQWLKIVILLQLSIMALLGPLNQAVISTLTHTYGINLEIPGAYVPPAAALGISTVEASYQTTIAIAFAGVGSFLWVHLANTYGRRPVMLLTTLIAAASSLGSGKAKKWSQLIAARVFNGIGTSSFFKSGAGLVSDCFFLHERGRAMGVFTLFLTNSAHVAPIPGGFLGQYVSYEWCYYLPAVLDITMFVVMLFCLPGHFIIASQFKLKYPSVSTTAVYYSYTFALGSILPAVTSATLFSRLYKFTPSQTGLAFGVGTLIGSTVGELLGGIVVDRSMYLSRKRLPGAGVVPEVRLHGIWSGAALHAAGLLIWGFTIACRTPWIGPTIGFSVMCFAIYYAADCYRPQTTEIAQVFNFGRQTFGMTVGFWAIIGGDNLGY